MAFVQGCTTYLPPQEVQPPDKDTITQILDEIRGKSFRLKIEFSKPGMRTKIFSEHDTRGRVMINCIWENDRDEVTHTSFVDEDQIFVKENGEWRESTKSETLPYELVRTVTSFEDFTYKTYKEGIFTYEFTPNLLFLSPTVKDVEGYLTMDSKTLKPIVIEAKGEEIYFKATFSNIDDEIYIEHPLSRIYYTRVSPVPNEQDLSIIKKRLFSLGADDSWFLKDELYIKTFYIDKGIIDRLLKKGLLSIYSARYLKEVSPAERERYGDNLVYLNGVNPIIIDTLVYSGNIQDIKLYEEGAIGQTISITFSDELRLLSPFLVMVDRKPVSFYQKFLGKDLSINGDKVDYSILRFGPLTTNYHLMEDL